MLPFTNHKMDNLKWQCKWVRIRWTADMLFSFPSWASFMVADV